ncbi:MAG: hypothetical protein R3F21_15960 [Myxococcota bacterium]
MGASNGKRRLGFIPMLMFGVVAVGIIGCSDGSGGGSGGVSDGRPERSLDLATITSGANGLLRLHGSSGNGSFGVPVSGGHDLDGDGHNDLALAAMRASPLGRGNAGEVFVLFGDGTVSGAIDTAVPQARVLRILGAAAFENAGSEVWMDDVTGDGIADLIIARQNHTPGAGRVGAGAVTILVGGAPLASQAATLAPVDLAAPPVGLTLTTFVGIASSDRLGMWIRTGDVTGDGIADLAMSADQENLGPSPDAGAVYLVRGGAALAAGGIVDLAEFGGAALPGDIARILPPPGSNEFHLGATLQVADLDGNGLAEVIIAATLNRAGGTLGPGPGAAGPAHGRGGPLDGRIYIAWDDNFAGVWPNGFSFSLDAAPGDTSEVRGATRNVSFGEELLGGLDFDDDGFADLFVGDIVGDLSTNNDRVNSGSGHLLYRAESLRGAPTIDLDAPPAGLRMTTFVGAAANDIASDTALQGDFDGDGLPDLAFSSPHGSPYGRGEAGIVHIFHGQSGPFPERIELRWGDQPDASLVRISEVHGVNAGDVLCYSADAGDHDQDGRDDLIVNEMLGDGLSPGTNDVGNLVVVSGDLIAGLP